ncbi:hypothetical protein T439DRAFT_367451 [Meredithblackwellia eburnea MCA 4105]
MFKFQATLLLATFLSLVGLTAAWSVDLYTGRLAKSGLHKGSCTGADKADQKLMAGANSCTRVSKIYVCNNDIDYYVQWSGPHGEKASAGMWAGNDRSHIIPLGGPQFVGRWVQESLSSRLGINKEVTIGVGTPGKEQSWGATKKYSLVMNDPKFC